MGKCNAMRVNTLTQQILVAMMTLVKAPMQMMQIGLGLETIIMTQCPPGRFLPRS